MSRSAAEIGAFWDGKYRANPEGFGRQPNAFLAEVADRIPAGAHVYVPGDGYGRNGLWLARRGYRVSIAELSTIGVALANKTAAQEGLELTAFETDVTQFDPGVIDAAVLIYLHLPPSQRVAFHAQIEARLSQGAPLILEGFTPDQRINGRTSGGPGNPTMLYTPEMLRADFPTMDIELLEERTLELHEGQYHEGIGDVVRLLAFKR